MKIEVSAIEGSCMFAGHPCSRALEDTILLCVWPRWIGDDGSPVNAEICLFSAPPRRGEEVRVLLGGALNYKEEVIVVATHIWDCCYGQGEGACLTTFALGADGQLYQAVTRAGYAGCFKAVQEDSKFFLHWHAFLRQDAANLEFRPRLEEVRGRALEIELSG